MNLQDKDGATALMWAAGTGHRKVVDILLTHSCDLNRQDKDGQTALIWACSNGSFFTYSLTHSLSSSTHSLTHSLTSSLGLVGNIPIAMALIDAGCDYSLKDKDCKSGMEWLREKTLVSHFNTR